MARFRSAIAITIATIAMVALAFAWRHTFPFPDTIAQHLPAGTLAYVHVNVTPEIRHHLASHLATLTSPLVDAVRVATSETDVRELAFAWYVPDGAVGPVAAFIVGQRRSQRTDARLPEVVRIGAVDLRTFVLHTRTIAPGPYESVLQPLRHRPVQAFVRPRAVGELPGSPLRAARELLPEALTAAGTIDRAGLVLRSDRRLPFAFRRHRFDLPAAPSPPALAIFGFPIREFAAALAAPPESALDRILAPSLPQTVDAAVGLTSGAVTLRLPGDVPDDLLRLAAAVVHPILRAKLLDGFPSALTVINPDAVSVTTDGAGRSVLSVEGSPVFSVIRSDDASVAITRRRLTMPTRCVDGSVYILQFIHSTSLLQASVSVSTDGDKFSICARAMGGI